MKKLKITQALVVSKSGIARAFFFTLPTHVDWGPYKEKISVKARELFNAELPFATTTTVTFVEVEVVDAMLPPDLKTPFHKELRDRIVEEFVKDNVDAICDDPRDFVDQLMRDGGDYTGYTDLTDAELAIEMLEVLDFRTWKDVKVEVEEEDKPTEWEKLALEVKDHMLKESADV